MAHTTRRRVAIAATAMFASAALLAGCASSDNGGGSSSSGGSGDSSSDNGGLLATQAGFLGDQSSGGDAVDGGTIDFSPFQLPPVLDPSNPRAQASGSTGGTEEINVYGSLMRYDPEKDSFVPQMAKDLSVSDDNLTWTLTLRDGVTFSDGSDYNAQAVVDSINRYSKVQGPNSDVFTGSVDSVEAADPTTVVFHLTHPWNELPAALSYGYGMIIAPAGYANPDDFQPIGAGPFTVGDFVPSTSLTLNANPDYWDGEPHLDTVNFTALTPGVQQLQALQSGDIDMTFLRSSQAVAQAAAEFPGYYEPLNLNDLLQINNRDGHPGANPDVRKAIAAAIDPEVISQQAFDGDNDPTTAIFPKWSKWHTDQAAAYDYDPEQARKFLDQAKADGYDGNIMYASVNIGSSKKIAQAVQSMLTDAGFTVNIDYFQPGDILQRLYVDHDFDITYASLSVGDASPLLRIYDALYSESRNNITGYTSPEMDQALAAANEAVGESDEKSTMADVAQQIHDDVPFLSVGAGANFVAWNSDIHGVTPSSDAIILLDKAWVAK